MKLLTHQSRRSAVACVLLAWPVFAAPALAEEASQHGISAVIAKRDQIANTTLGLDYFTTAHHPPQPTPDGGVYQYYSGSRGDGAIYWSEQTGAHYIHGPILEFFVDRGHEAALGYPLDDPQTGRSHDCPTKDTRERQEFEFRSRGIESARPIVSHVCWDSNGVYLSYVLES